MSPGPGDGVVGDNLRVRVPPLKCQGIKTKLVPAISRYLDRDAEGVWIEPFLGSGVVVLNVLPQKAILADTNPHLIRFYQAIQNGEIDGQKTRVFLEREGSRLATGGEEHYYRVRERFNSYGCPLDFLFLNRSCFNGVVRFNSKGHFNVPYGHKPQRFAPAYITKIVNQVEGFSAATRMLDWSFVCQDFQKTIQDAASRDFVYCDPPYVGRHVDYYHPWDERQENRLYDSLKNTRARFMLSTWHSNRHRENRFIQELWGEFPILTQEHFYHVGAYEKNRKPMLEAIITNYQPTNSVKEPVRAMEQFILLEKEAGYVPAADSLLASQGNR